MPVPTLNDVRIKARNITSTLSEQQMSDATLDNYINTAIQFDFPQELRLFNLRKTLTFYTQPNQDRYYTGKALPNGVPIPTTNPLYDFQNRYTAVHPPCYVGGIAAFYTQFRDIFFNYYPQVTNIADTLLRGDGTQGPFSGTLVGKPALQYQVNFNCLDIGGQSMVLVDYPMTNITGALGIPGVQQQTPSPYGQINYVTGAYTLNFPAATQSGAPIIAETVPYSAGMPYSILYFEDYFQLRQVPDKVYPVTLEVDAKPTELLSSSQEVILNQFWQYIAWLTSKKIFEDRRDVESIQRIMPLLKEQERLCLRSTLELNCNMRAQTIYTQGFKLGATWFSAGWPY